MSGLQSRRRRDTTPGMSLESRFTRHTPRAFGVWFGCALLAVLGSLSACVSSADDDKGKTCKDGAEGCQCFGNDTCLNDLACLSNVCVSLQEADASDGKGADKPRGSKNDSDAAGAESESSNDDETDSTPPKKGSSGGTVSSDTEKDDAVAPDSDSSDSPTEQGTTDEPATDEPATDEPATDEPATDEPATDTTSESLPTAECTTSEGFCSDGTAQDCIAGQWSEHDCSSCALLNCGVSCCGSVWALVAETFPYARRDDLLLSFTESATQATTSASLEAIREFAGVGFTLSASFTIDPAAVSFSATVVGDVLVEVSLERDDTTGCLYDTSGGVLISENICWGDWELTGYGGVASTVLIRLQSAETQNVSLTVNSLSF